MKSSTMETPEIEVFTERAGTATAVASTHLSNRGIERGAKLTVQPFFNKSGALDCK